ncbi:Lysophospholipase NTE1 [Ceratocystis lukuohia]|uniref:Lysophospholipase NTE1 n=1 Tax=Ceratocystis lukuohia TaxID=2019550 RepID=A0ABR4MQ61_9PEZI
MDSVLSSSEALSSSANVIARSLETAAAGVAELTEAQGPSTWLGLLGRIILFILHLVSSVLYWSLRLTTMSLPTFIFTAFPSTWTVTMNATTLIIIMFIICSAVAWVVRYRFLNMYSRLPPEPQRKEPNVDLPPDNHDEGHKSGISNYLDEFLSAIKIFGYLERSVFHELTRSMQTKRLVAGEAFNLEEEKGFCIVVDGLVEIFVKSGSRTPYEKPATYDSDSTDYDSPGYAPHQYQLLTEVRNGTPMSSLFSIMSLFTEDINVYSSNDEPTRKQPDAFPPEHPFRDHNPAEMASAPGTPPLVATEPTQTEASGSFPNIPAIDLQSTSKPANGHRYPRPPLKHRGTSVSAHPDIIARATVDTTLAIIPASAFRRLIKVYPKATAHIVHVILSRFQRVTLANAYNYLGLTDDVVRTESSLIRYTLCQLPNELRGEALNRLKEKFRDERDNLRENGEDPKVIALHNPVFGRRQRSSTGLRKDAVLSSLSKQIVEGSTGSTIAPPRNPLPRASKPPELVDHVRPPKRVGTYGTSPRVSLEHSGRRVIDPFAKQGTRKPIDIRDSVAEDNVFRASVLECILQSLGLGQSALPSRESESAEGSPGLGSFDRRARHTPTNAFGIMGPFESGSGEGDTESMASGSTSAFHSPSVHALADDMRDDLEILFFPKGSVLVEEGEHTAGLYYVIDGFLDMGTTNMETSTGILEVDPASYHTSSTSSPDEDGHEGIRSHRAKRRPRKSIALIKPGCLAGYIGGVTSYRSFIDIRAKTDVYVGFLPRASVERIVDKFPIILLTMAKRLTNILPRLILHIDFALEWVQVNAGQVLFHQGEESEAIYIVLNGRLRLVEEKKDSQINVLAEYGQGESVGEIEVMTESTRPGTLHAIRDTELVKFPRTLFNSLAQEHPNIMMKVSKIIASRMRKLIEDPSTLNLGDSRSSAAFQKGFSTNNLRTVAVLPVTTGIPVMDFATRLMAAFAQVGPPNGAVCLNQDVILNHMGKHAFNRMGKLKLAQYLADLEEKHSLVLYVADTSVNSPWTQTCITQADSILLLALADGSPEIGEYERFMLGMKSTARKTLILLHAERFSQPGLTRSWLRNRMWVNGGHYHMQMPLGPSSIPVTQPRRLGSALKERVQIIQAEIQKYTSRKIRPGQYYTPELPSKGDFNRLARRLCGKSVGLVLGGGGARGIAQIGIIRALEEAGIPVDLIGGTSIGSFVGALYARHADVVPMFGLAKKFAGRMASIWRFAFDLTYPTASYTTGHEFNRGIFKIFGKTQIEDFWLEYYCNTTNISKSRQEIHTSGYAWRYIRASMSLAGLLPPLCDEGSMLLDGGYIDNLTVAHMKSLGAAIIFAVDVGALDDNTPQTYGDSLSGLWAFLNRWNPLSGHPNPPTLSEIQARLAYVSSVDALERAKTMPGCIYMRPPIDDYGTLDFGKFTEIYDVGHKFGTDFLAQLRKEGKLPLQEETEAASKALRRTMAPRRASI